MFFAQSLKLLAIGVLLAGLALTVQRWPERWSPEQSNRVLSCLDESLNDIKAGRTARDCPTSLTADQERQQMIVAGTFFAGGAVSAIILWWMAAMAANQARLVELAEAGRRGQAGPTDQTVSKPN